MATKIKSSETVLFIGDSITDCGRREAHRPLGAGYVKLFDDLFIQREPEKRVQFINKGISGDRVTGLWNRWTDDVIRHRPDWLSIKIGINDLHSHWRGDKENGVSPEKFEATYVRILDCMRAELPRCRILLIDPFYISQTKTHECQRREILKLLPAYIDIVHRMSRTYKTRLVKTHEMFQRLLKHYDADTFCPEPVHPNPTGHLAIAEAVYQALS